LTSYFALRTKNRDNQAIDFTYQHIQHGWYPIMPKPLLFFQHKRGQNKIKIQYSGDKLSISKIILYHILWQDLNLLTPFTLFINVPILLKKLTFQDLTPFFLTPFFFDPFLLAPESQGYVLCCLILVESNPCSLRVLLHNKVIMQICISSRLSWNAGCFLYRQTQALYLASLRNFGSVPIFG